MGKGHQDKVAVVSGAAAGLGQAFAMRLAEDGAHVVLVDRASADDTLRRVQGKGRQAIAVACDVSDPADVAKLAAQVDAKFGRADILVNAAGIYPVQAFDDITFEDWRKVLAVNLDSMFLMTKAFSGGMRQRGWGRIVNIASDTVSLTVPDFTHYITSKSGVIGFTRAIATEFAKKGVTANVIAPGLTRTPGTLARPESGWAGRNSVEGWFEMIAEHVPMGRVGVPDDLVGTMSYLTSDDSAYVTGQTIFVCGGLVRA
jgi:NAD(P)-dependent dehydrogenase (short-subunit alcohol dehydrogenase family)